MHPKKRIPTHPGEVLLEEFLAPLAITQVAMAAHIGVPVQRINEIVRGKRGITPATAWLLAQERRAQRALAHVQCRPDARPHLDFHVAPRVRRLSDPVGLELVELELDRLPHLAVLVAEGLRVRTSLLEPAHHRADRAQAGPKIRSSPNL